MRRLVLAFPLAVLITVACGTVSPALAPSSPSTLPSATAAALPKPIRQPITRTSPAAQVAWVLAQDDPQQGRWLIGVDPSGATVATVDVMKLGSGGMTRSADGASLVLFTEDRIDMYSALDGKHTATYRAAGSRVVASAFSADGRWVALLLQGEVLQLLDLRSGLTQTLSYVHDPKASLPGLSGNGASVVWGTLAFAPDSARLYVVSDWGGPARLGAYALASDTWGATGSIVDGPSQKFPSCAGPAMAVKVAQGGRAFAAFCHVDGTVWLVDVPTLAGITVLHPTQRNPFWLSPVFTPDGQLLYLHQSPSFGDEMQVVDLESRRVLGPAKTPTRVADPGPFSLFGSVAYAGGTASTQPISPDGLRLYSAMADGIVVLHVPDLAPITVLAKGTGCDEVWISGDGKTVYGTSGSKLVIARDDGAGVRTVDLGRRYLMFVATERG